MTIYGLKSSSAEFRAHLAYTLNDIGFLSNKVDPDVWCRPTFKPNDFDYYKYILCYVDDISFISHDLDIALRRIQVIFNFKGDKMEQPGIYFGDQVGKMIVDGTEG